MCRPYGWVFGPKFSKQGPFFGSSSINMGGLPKNGLFSAKIHHISGYESKFRLEEGVRPFRSKT